MRTFRYRALPWAVYLTVGSIVFLYWYFRTPSSGFKMHGDTENRIIKLKRIIQNKEVNYDFQKEIDIMNEKQTPMDDSKLIEIIRNYYLEPPSETPYDMDDPENYHYSAGQTSYVDTKLNALENGFYVESRAFTGEKESTTLFFEKARLWNGLLLEPDPNQYALLKRKHRRAFLMNACLNDKRYPTKMTLSHRDGSDPSKPGKSTYTAQCFPLYSVLKALEQTQMTFLSLNFFETGSGPESEYNFLALFPFEKFNVTFVGIRNSFSSAKPPRAMEDMMQEKGFKLEGRLSTDDQWVSDLVFLHQNSKLVPEVFWTGTNIFRAVVVLLILYLIANVVVYRYLETKYNLQY